MVLRCLSEGQQCIFPIRLQLYVYLMVNDGLLELYCYIVGTVGFCVLDIHMYHYHSTGDAHLHLARAGIVLHHESEDAENAPLVADNSAPSLYPSTCIELALHVEMENENARRHTLSQSNFCLVSGSARRRLLKVFSPMLWYVSFSVLWYLPSSSSTSARIFVAEDTPPLALMVGGRVKEVVCVDSSWTWWWFTHQEHAQLARWTRTLPCS